MRAWISKIDDKTGKIECGGPDNRISREYKTEKTLLKYALKNKRNGRYKITIHADFQNTKYRKADKILIIEVKNQNKEDK